MKVEDFAVWLSAISGMSEDQRREAMVALEKASVVGGAAAASAKKGGKRGRQEDALGTTGVERVAAQGCPHCAGREIVGWGRSHGLLRFRCKSCGRTFNTLTKTPMAHLRKKDRWLDHARAMIEGKSLAKTAALCGIHPTTAFRWRHRFLRAPASDKPRGLRGIVEADETFVLEILQGPTVRPAEKGAKARRNGQASWPSPGQHSRSSSPATGTAPPSTRSWPRSTALAVSPRARRNRHAGQSSRRRWRQGDRRLSPVEPGLPSTPCRRRESRPPRRRTCTSTTSTPITAVSSNGSTASTASPPRTCPIISVGGALSKPGATNSNRQAGSKAESVETRPHQQITL